MKNIIIKIKNIFCHHDWKDMDTFITLNCTWTLFQCTKCGKQEFDY